MDPEKILIDWRRLLDELSHENPTEIPSVETLTQTAAGSLRLSVSREGACALLIPFRAGSFQEPENKSETVRTRKIVLMLNGRPVQFMETRCEDNSLIDVFARYVSDVLRRVENGASGTRAIEEALAEFRRLLHVPSRSRKDPRVIIGLLGELVTLEEILRLDPRGVSMWFGPDQDKHDFRSGRVSIEVKSSLSAEGKLVHINGLRQLHCAPDEFLILRQLHFERNSKGSLCVTDLVTTLAELTVSVDLFLDKLKKIGYEESNRDSWDMDRFNLIAATPYRISDGFPKLTPDSVTPAWPIWGIGNVKYELDLSSASDFRIDDEWPDVLREICSCQ